MADSLAARVRCTATDRPPSPSHVAAVESLTLKDGRALCVRTWPGAAEPTLVLLHGMLDSSEGWTQLTKGLTCRRIAFDLPGFCCSDAPAQASIRGYALDIAEGLEMLGVTRFTLIGHSLGGAVATALAELMPERVSGLVLVAPAGFGRIHLAEAASVWGVSDLAAAALRVTLCNRLAIAAAYATLVTNGKSPERELLERLTSRGSCMVDGALQATRALSAAGRSRDAFYRRRVQYLGPVYAIWGDRDRLVPPSHREGVRAAFPHASIEVWRGVGHHPAHERIEELIAVVTRAASAEMADARPAGPARTRRRRSPNPTGAVHRQPDRRREPAPGIGEQVLRPAPTGQ